MIQGWNIHEQSNITADLLLTNFKFDMQEQQEARNVTFEHMLALATNDGRQHIAATSLGFRLSKDVSQGSALACFEQSRTV